MKHTYFKTRVNNGINTNTFEPVYMPEISIERGKWDLVVDDGRVVSFENKGEAELFCQDLEQQNLHMDQ